MPCDMRLFSFRRHNSLRHCRTYEISKRGRGNVRHSNRTATDCRNLAYGRNYHRLCLGRTFMGSILELGSERNMVAPVPACLSDSIAWQIYSGLASAAQDSERIPDSLFCSDAFPLVRCKPDFFRTSFLYLKTTITTIQYIKCAVPEKTQRI